MQIVMSSEWWPMKASSTPIARGGAAVGWMYFALQGVSVNKLKERPPTDLVLNYMDVNGKDWSCSAKIEGQGMLATPDDFKSVH